MRTISGYITSVQESRFRLLADDGRGLLFTLYRNALPEHAGLIALHADNAHVSVDYQGEPSFTSAVAYAVQRIG